VTYRPLPGPRRLKEALWRRLEHRFARREAVEAIRVEIGEEVAGLGQELARTAEMLASIQSDIRSLASGLAQVSENQRGLETRLDQLRVAFDRRIDAALAEAVRAAEDVTALTVMLNPDHPLPSLGGWALSPDSARYLVELVFEMSPRHILECGSGSSTILMGLAVRGTGAGRVTSLEHDPQYLEITRELVGRHGLTDIVELVYAPLTELDVGGRSFHWYDLPAGWLEGRTFDLLVVDGPPSTGEMNRYPVLPMMAGHLSDRAVVFLDDADRADERRALELWQERFPEFDLEVLEHRKGAAILRRRPVDRDAPV